MAACRPVFVAASCPVDCASVIRYLARSVAGFCSPGPVTEGPGCHASMDGRGHLWGIFPALHVEGITAASPGQSTSKHVCRMGLTCHIHMATLAAHDGTPLSAWVVRAGSQAREQAWRSWFGRRCSEIRPEPVHAWLSGEPWDYTTAWKRPEKRHMRLQQGTGSPSTRPRGAAGSPRLRTGLPT